MKNGKKKIINMFKEDFIPNELARVLHELGFNDQCFTTIIAGKVCEHKVDGVCPLHNLHCSHPNCEIVKGSEVGLPTYRQAFRFTRDKFGYHNEVIWDHSEPIIWYYAITKIGDINPESKSISSYPDNVFKTPEEAELEGLKKLIEIVKKDA